MLIDPLVWSVLLMLLGLALVVLEIFIPSGGMLGILATVSVIASIGLAFYHAGPQVGFIFIMTAVVSVPVALAAAFKLLPNTPVGRHLLLQTPTSEEVMPDDEERRRLRGLVGKTGKAKTMMLPSGAVTVEGQTVDAVSNGMPIEPGQTVRVVEVRGARVVVRPVEPEEAEQPTAKASSDDVLSRPIESLGIDFNEPLG